MQSPQDPQQELALIQLAQILIQRCQQYRMQHPYSGCITTPSYPPSFGLPCVPYPSALQPITPKRRTRYAESQDEDVFKQVPFNLSTVAYVNKTNITVTVGEVRRRMGAPEYTNSERICSLTRYGRSVHFEFRMNFAKHGFFLYINGNKRQADKSGTLTWLLEEEASILVRDFKFLTGEISRSALAAVTVAAAGANIDRLLAQIPAIKDHLIRVKKNFAKLCMPPADIAFCERHGAKFDPLMNRFSLETHGFGPPAVIAAIDVLFQLINTIEEKCPTPEQITKMMAPRETISYSNSSESLPYSGSAQAARNEARESATDVDAALFDRFDFEHAYLPGTACLVAPRIRSGGSLIKVTIGELRRRALGPEKYVESMIMAYMRKGRRSTAQAALRETLAKLGIQSSTTISSRSWSALTESEAQALAIETAQALFCLTPTPIMSDDTPAEVAQCLRFLLTTVRDAMYKIGSDPSNFGAVQTVADVHLLRFALITHHFGHMFIGHVMVWLYFSTCRLADNVAVVVEGEKDTVEGEKDTVEGRKDSVEGRKDTAEGRKDTVEGEKDTVEGKKDSVEGRKDTVEGRKDTVEGEKDTVEGEKDTVEGRNDTVEGEKDTVEGRKDTVEGRKDTVEGEKDMVEGQMVTVE